MRYIVEGADGSHVEVDAVDWMMAMAKAIAQLGIEVSGWACQTRPDGSVIVVDPRTGSSWQVRSAGPDEQSSSGVIEGRTVVPQVPDREDDLLAGTAQAPPVPSAPPPLSVPEPTAAPPTLAMPTPTASRPAADPPAERPRPRPTTEPRPAPFRQPTTMYSGPFDPAVTAPPQSTPAQPVPEDLAERLFELTMELSAAGDPHEACRRALDVCLSLVECEAGSVLRGGLNDANLTFVAVAGPAAEQLLNKKLPFGVGIVGASFDLGITIGVDDVGADPRHASQVDEQTGFRTRSVLCVPVQGREQYHGAVQLLNPLGGTFTGWHRDAVEQLAASLATTLDGL